MSPNILNKLMTCDIVHLSFLFLFSFSIFIILFFSFFLLYSLLFLFFFWLFHFSLKTSSLIFKQKKCILKFKRHFFHIFFVLGCSILKGVISFHSKVRYQRILLNYFRLKDWKLREKIQQAMIPTVISRLIILADCSII